MPKIEFDEEVASLLDKNGGLNSFEDVPTFIRLMVDEYDADKQILLLRILQNSSSKVQLKSVSTSSSDYIFVY